MITLKQIAQQSGFSTPTVSEILNDKGVYSQETRKKVLAVARELGYRPNASARAIQSGRFNTITWLSSTHGSSRFMTSTLLDGVIEELDRHQLQLHIARICDDKLTDPDYLPSALRHLSCDGLLIDYTQDIPPRFWDLVQETKLPAIWINSKQKYDSVYPDDQAAMSQLTEHMIDHGHKHIGYAKFGGSSNHYSIEQRLKGYTQSMQKAGLKPLIRQNLNAQERDIHVCSQKLIQDHPQVTAWVCYGDNIAISICLQWLKQGKDVGNKHHVGTTAAGMSIPDRMLQYFPITTTPRIWSSVGHQAVNMLLKKIKSPQRRQSSKAIIVDAPISTPNV